MSEDNITSPGTQLADEMYPPIPAPEEPTQVVSEQPLDTPSGDDTPPADPLAAAEENDPDAGSDEPGDGDIGQPGDDDPDSVELETFEQLAEHLDTEPEFLEGLSVTQKVNGKEVQVKLSDALSTHRKVEAADDYLAEAKAKSKAIVQESRQAEERLGESVAIAGAMLQQIESSLDSDVADINWAQLRADDPAEYSARKQDVTDRREALNKLKGEVGNKYRESLKQYKDQQEATRLERLPEEHNILTEKVPEWVDEEKASVERAEVIQYLNTEGFSEQEIQTVAFSGRGLSLAVKAKRYDKAKGKANAARKKVVRIPKVLKPGAKPADTGKPTPDPSDRTSLLYG